MLRRSCGTFHAPSRPMSRPATSTCPSVATSSRSKSLRNVDLPGARRADEEDELALGDVEGDLTQGDDFALVGLADVLESNHESPMTVPGRCVSCGSGQPVAGSCAARARHCRYASMNASRSPSITACTLPVSKPRPLVLHELVRRERVGADLIPERDVALVARQRLELLAVLLPLRARRAGRRGSASPSPCSASAIARSGTTRRRRSAGA